MNYQEMRAICKTIADNARAPYHGPIDDIAPCEDAMFLARIIAALDTKFGTYFELKFGGAGDGGEALAGLLDILIEMQVISLNMDSLRGEKE